MTTQLTEDLQEALANQARAREGVEGAAEEVGAHHTNVYVLIDYSAYTKVYGPFRSLNAAKDWGLVNSENFDIHEIMRPPGLEDVGFVLKDPNPEPTLEDQGIHPDQMTTADFDYPHGDDSRT